MPWCAFCKATSSGYDDGHWEDVVEGLHICRSCVEKTDESEIRIETVSQPANSPNLKVTDGPVTLLLGEKILTLVGTEARRMSQGLFDAQSKVFKTSESCEPTFGPSPTLEGLRDLAGRLQRMENLIEAMADIEVARCDHEVNPEATGNFTRAYNEFKWGLTK